MRHSSWKHLKVLIAVVPLTSPFGSWAAQPAVSGLPYADTHNIAQAAPAASGSANAPLEIYKQGNIDPYALYLGSPNNWYDAIPADKVLSHGTVKAEPGEVSAPKDGKKVTWMGTGQIYAQSKSTLDRLDYLDAESALVFDAIIHEPPQSNVTIRVDCKYPCIGLVDATNYIKSLPVGQKTTIKIPLSCFAATGTDFGMVNTPFLVYTTSRFVASFANIRWVPGAGKDADVMSCKKRS